MKKTVLLGLAVLGMMTSCSNDEVYDSVKSNDNAIAFGTFVNKTTRATDITDKNIENFSVYGWTASSNDANATWGQIFNKEEVKGSGTTADDSKVTGWSYNNIQYWTAGLYYYFHAVAPSITSATLKPYESEGAKDYKKATITYTNLTTEADGTISGGTEDLLYAYKGDIQGLASGTDLVRLEFKHLLSRVKFRFVATDETGTDTNGNTIDYNPDNAHYAIYNVKLTGSEMSGSIKVDAAATDWYAQPWTFDASTDKTNTVGLNFDAAKYQKNTNVTNPGDELTTKITKGEDTYYYFNNDGEGETDHLYLIPVAEDKSGYGLTFDIDYFLTVPDDSSNDGFLWNDTNDLAGTWIKAKGEITALTTVAMKIGYSYVYTIAVNAKDLSKRDTDDPETLDPILFTVKSVEVWKPNGDDWEQITYPASED
jgi:hypothetical protein